jgi:ATP-binding cassette, subfamily C, bacteriocin exporter
MKADKITRIRKYSVLQHDSTDCGAACLVSIIKYLGGNSSIEEIRKLSGTSQQGTSMLGLFQASKKYGLDSVGYEASINDIIGFKDILILHVINDKGFEHFIICYGFTDNKFIIWDPAIGLKYLSENELKEIWISKKCLSVIPTPHFRFIKVNDKRIFRWIVSHIWPEKDILLISIVIGVVVSLLGMVMALFTQKLIDKILPSGDLKLLFISSFLVLALLLSRIAFTAIRQHLLLSQGMSFNVRIVDMFYGKLLGLPKSFFDTRKTGDFVARLNDTTRIQRVIADMAAIYFIDFLIVCITLVLIFHYSKIAAIICIICIPVFYLIANNWTARITSSQHDLMSGYALNESNFIDSLKGITEIKCMNWQDNFSEKNRNIYTDYQKRAVVLGKQKVSMNFIVSLIGTLFMMIILFYCSYQVMRYNLTQGELMAILTLSSTMLPSILNISLISIPISEVKVALTRMFEFTQIDPEAQPEPVINEYLLKIDKLDLQNISFRFPGQPLLLNNISIQLEKGKVVSLVGESGSGKSTLAHIILRHYLVESGIIVINGNISSEDVSLKTWRSCIGLVPQDIHVFNGTILQNLIPNLSEDKLKETIEKIEEFGLADFINSFPSGLLTLVGEEGLNLSGGQKQILAFIRVLLKEPQILIIDEGTSNLDINTEEIIISLILKLKSQIGILLISHRINIIKKLSDHIFLLENRSIKEGGTHHELVIRDNLYSRFWKDFS